MKRESRVNMSSAAQLLTSRDLPTVELQSMCVFSLSVNVSTFDLDNNLLAFVYCFGENVNHSLHAPLYSLFTANIMTIIQQILLKH